MSSEFTPEQKKFLQRDKIIQLSIILFLLLFSEATQWLKAKDIILLNNISPIVTTETTFVAIILNVLYNLKKPVWAVECASLYFVMLCIMMYYSWSVWDILIFFINIGVILAIIVKKQYIVNMLDKTK